MCACVCMGLIHMTDRNPETSREQGVLIPLLIPPDTKLQTACPSFCRQESCTEYPTPSFNRLEEGFFYPEWWLEQWRELHKATLAKIK